MRETKSKQVGGRGYTYHVTQFGAREGGRVLVRLLKMIGGAAGEAMANDTEGFDMVVVGRMISNVAETVSEQDFDYLVDTFMKTTSVSGGTYGDRQVPLGTDGVFDLHFAGAYQELGQWLLFAIETNFGGFLGEGGLVEAARNVRQGSEANAPAKSVSRSPNTSATSG